VDTFGSGIALQALQSVPGGRFIGEPVKILIIDDHALFRAGLRMLLSTIGHNVVCLEAGTIADALALIAQRTDLQLCLLDLTLKNEQALGAIHKIKEIAPQISVVVVSGSDDNDTISRCIDAGAMSFISKSATPDVLRQALGHILKGAVYLPHQINSAMDDAPQNPLTPRQQQVLQALSRGLPNKLIARELNLSENTVKEHIAAVFAALGVRNRTEAVIKASRLQLQELPATVRG
jgi:DNA-binding NarL/FixJ family response regulator